jgi:hypothetical protein
MGSCQWSSLHANQPDLFQAVRDTTTMLEIVSRFKRKRRISGQQDGALHAWCIKDSANSNNVCLSFASFSVGAETGRKFDVDLEGCFI